MAPMFEDQHRQLYSRLVGALQARPDVAADPDANPPDHWFRPNELIVHKEAGTLMARVESMRFERVADLGYLGFEAVGSVLSPRGGPESRSPLPFALYRREGLEPAELIDHLRTLRVSSSDRLVSLNHLVNAHPHVSPSAGPPMPAPFVPRPTGDAGAGVLVGVVDTGFWPQHSWVPGAIAPLTSLADDGEEPGRRLGFSAGHGTGVAGVVRQIAPGARVVVAGTLDPDGVADDAQIGAAITALARANAKVINLSLGCYTLLDRPPAAMAAALEALPPDVAIVASAGNKPTIRPMWPAAFSRVIAVGALDPRTGGRANFSSYGSWVDACAPGVGIDSSFFVTSAPLEATRAPGPFAGYAAWNGTSFAAPQLAGAIAIEMWRSPGLTAREAAARLLAQGRLVPALGSAFSPHL
jgi:subtilisin family serine protease